MIGNGLERRLSMLRTRAIVVGVLLIIAFCSWVGAQEGLGNPKTGMALYDQNCLRCHGGNGEGNGLEGRFLIVPPANFQSTKSRLKTDWELYNVIAHGVAVSPMHGWRGRLTDQQMWDVISYIRLLAPFVPIS
jgi:cytochrome c oxidase cbb3-type subunit 3